MNFTIQLCVNSILIMRKQYNSQIKGNHLLAHFVHTSLKLWSWENGHNNNPSIHGSRWTLTSQKQRANRKILSTNRTRILTPLQPACQPASSINIHIKCDVKTHTNNNRVCVCVFVCVTSVIVFLLLTLNLIPFIPCCCCCCSLAWPLQRVCVTPLLPRWSRFPANDWRNPNHYA